METDTKNMLFRSKTLLGRKVVNQSGENLGQIEEFALDPERGCVEYAVLSFGGLFGAGEKFFAVPWEALQIDHAHNDFIVNVEKRTLQDGQGFDPDAWPSEPDTRTFPIRNRTGRTPGDVMYPPEQTDMTDETRREER